MNEFGLKADNASISKYGLGNVAAAYWNLDPSELIEDTILRGEGSLSSTGALAIETGEFTGRAPKDRYVVKDDVTADKVWWGDVNIAFDADKFDALYNRVTAYLSGKEVYVRDAYACADNDYRLNIRVITETPFANLFCYNMFLRPKQEEIKNFNEDWTIVAAPGFKATPEIDGTKNHNFAILNFKKKTILIGGTGYTGEMKKGIFSVLNFVLPTERNVLSMHCSANIGKDGDTAIFFGLSGTGKTTLSSDPNRRLIGDDEHGWAENSVFNFEGGCYAKTYKLSKESEPGIFAASNRFGAILENVVLNDKNEPDFNDKSIAENGRSAYPLSFIDGVEPTSKGPVAKDMFFLTADAFGVLPPVAKLNRSQAMYYFLSGYTAKLAGTEVGVTEPTATFSTCFGAPFMMRNAQEYADLLGHYIDKHNIKVWLVNTGWTGGAYGVGERFPLKVTRRIIEAIQKNELDNTGFETEGFFGLNLPTEIKGVDAKLLNAKNTWSDTSAYDTAATKLAGMFHENFKKFTKATSDVAAGGPTV